jgi:hypothetical protein
MKTKPTKISTYDKYMASVNWLEGAETKEGRMRLTTTDPMAFALIYLPHHLKDSRKRITIAEVHLDWAEQAKKWMFPPEDGEQGPRDANIAPRNTGKSTWHFLILPLWAAAHGHRMFAAAFADSGTQAEEHLKTFKRELDDNKLLRDDFPLLTSPARRERGQAVSDNRAMIVQNNGFAFAAKGIDASNLGLKVGNTRPDLIIFDDVEPDEASYSAYQAEKRRKTLVDAILPMNFQAVVIFVGTVTMEGGITHQLVKVSESREAPEPWIVDEGIKVHYYAPIIDNDDGTQRSIWPEKWPLDYLKAREHTRSYAKNFKNLPVNENGDYWTDGDFRYGPITGITKTMISIDGAVTTKKTSDFTGLANIAYRPRRRGQGAVEDVLPKCLVQDIQQVKLSGEALRRKVLTMITQSPTPVTMIYVEVNQGGDLWLSVFHDMPCKVEVVVNTINKEVRASRLLNWYQRFYVQHLRKFPALEDQMKSYPGVLHDDMIDAVGQGVAYYARSTKKAPSMQGRAMSYV